MVDLVRNTHSLQDKTRGSRSRETCTSVRPFGLVADSAKIAGWTLVTRITGFGRMAVMAAVLGPTYFNNLFQTCVLLPDAILALLGGQLIGAILVPSLVRWLDVRDRMAVRRLACGFLGMLTAIFCVVVVLSVVAAPLLLALMTAAVDDAVVRQKQQQIGWPLLAVLMPTILLYGVSATSAAVQNAHGRFALAAAAPAVENLGCMAVMGTSALMFGAGTDLDKVTTSQLLLLGMGITAAVGMHAAVQWWGAYRVGVTLVPWAGWRDPEVRRIFRMAFISMGYAVLYNATYFGLVVVSGRIAGGVIAFQISFALVMLPIALGAVPLATAQLPRLARSFDQQDPREFDYIYHRSLAFALFVALPAGLLYFTMSDILALAVAFGQMATMAGVSVIASCIGSLGLATIGEAAFSVSTSASYARRDALRPLWAMALRAAIAFIGMGVALAAMDGTAVLWTLGLTVAAANLAAAVYLYSCLTRGQPKVPGYVARSVLVELAVSTISVAPGVFFSTWFQDSVENRYQNIGAAAAAIAISVACYLTIQWMRGSEELKLLLSLIQGTILPSDKTSRTGYVVEEEDSGVGPS